MSITSVLIVLINIPYFLPVVYIIIIIISKPLCDGKDYLRLLYLVYKSFKLLKLPNWLRLVLLHRLSPEALTDNTWLCVQYFQMTSKIGRCLLSPKWNMFRSAVVTSSFLNWLMCQKQASRTGTSSEIPQLLWYVITSPCLWCLFLAKHSWFIRQVYRMGIRHRIGLFPVNSTKSNSCDSNKYIFFVFHNKRNIQYNHSDKQIYHSVLFRLVFVTSNCVGSLSSSGSSL